MRTRRGFLNLHASAVYTNEVAYTTSRQPRFLNAREDDPLSLKVKVTATFRDAQNL